MAIAITYTRFGGPEVLQVTEVAIPEPGPGQVRVAVRAASVNPLDLKIRRGELAKVFPTPFPVTPGMDLAGVIDAVGGGVQGLAVGDEVFGVGLAGSYAQYALAASVVAKPAGLSWADAAALTAAGEAAYRALAQLDVQAGQTLLIHGAAGSVGAIATQLAVARGITVIGTARADDADNVRAAGGIAVTYGDGWPARVRTAAERGVQAVLDAAGAGVLPGSVELVGGPEHVITLADMGAAAYGVRFSGGDSADRAAWALPELANLAAAGKLNIRIAKIYPLADAAQVHADLERGTVRGKVVLLP